MIRAALLLTFFRLKNSLRTIFTDPRKAVPVIVVAIALAFPYIVLGQIGSLPRRPLRMRGMGHMPFMNPHLPALCLWLIVIAMGVAVISAALGSQTLGFPMSDVDYLFPSPISRRIVLFLKLPVMTLRGAFAMAVPVVIMGTMLSSVVPQLRGETASGPPFWTCVVAIAFGLGIPFNLALTVTLAVNNRKAIQRWVGILSLIFAAAVIWIGTTAGADYLFEVVTTGWIHWLMLPCSMAAEVVTSSLLHQPLHHQVAILFAAYVGSLIPALCVSSNWYEQSIVSSERFTAVRDAIKGGASPFAVMASSSTLKRQAKRDYTIPPFGRGAGALVWAHFCSAAKRPLLTFGGSIVAGIAFGAYVGLFNIHRMEPQTFMRTNNTGQTSSTTFDPSIGFLGLMSGFTQFMFFVTVAMLFQALGRVACEQAIRRREIVNPLPIAGYQAVAADLAVPFFCLLIICLSATVTAGIIGKVGLLLFAFMMCVLLPLRTAARMILQYLVMLGFPDAADPTQKLAVSVAYGVASLPFLVIEVVACVPSLIFHSLWSALLPVAMIQIPFLVFLLYIAGKAREKAIASGEPVSLVTMLRNR